MSDIYAFFFLLGHVVFSLSGLLSGEFSGRVRHRVGSQAKVSASTSGKRTRIGFGLLPDHSGVRVRIRSERTGRGRS